ncbi:orotidine-5'-phosphate decarboxylase [Rhodococcus sp. BP-252]|uniref:Orotidine 5'-phosphate decarboxylase n=1 Tax=Rhodococcoides kyotonense TaxID=398843 RepID=A0A177YG62_9NOCA|nr:MULTISPECIES: orotidine-5'-phosphate decarboxylase [Rhodococcus]MBY6409959.1 orotidine-5'-phosphate decarboxylase [Rhodococcus sp. BP-320]MBY6414927.1 orotidine-5'-phosphate decarboxylase [Rhodococcus sp. BP-321]MBY6421369.1 orotidine-5'-phosphate decarboxylase [Rhodococcus sp. BP-324]MBY6425765.1 orotidine-5'-phosphate decarboxylase [Rhodococcus sp. BP-323]MBY6429823.1 orotidine-5'-phosphate decarboxylase [Rhodococcus sp. BP-322]
MSKTWADRLRAATAARGRLCVGIDPHPSLLDAWGLPRSADGLETFAELCVEAFVGEVAVVKPQVAFFEAYGSAGYAVLERTVSVLRDAGTLVVADAKRGDIGSTMSAYAQTWLGEDSPLSSDAVTVSPYLGFDSLRETFDLAARNGRGVFVLARTSNAEGADLQTATASHRSVAQSIVDGAADIDRDGRATAGLVVGATRDHGLDLSDFTGPILAPGLGAQGAGVDDLAQIFAGSRELLLPNSSRGVLAAGPSVTALRDAATTLRDEVEAGLA